MDFWKKLQSIDRRWIYLVVWLVVMLPLIFPFKIKTTKEKLTAHGGLALKAEFNYGIGLRELTDQFFPGT